MDPEPTPVSEPDYGVTVHRDLPVVVRDGTRLSTDIYRPAQPETGDPTGDEAPGLVLRTPYDKGARTRSDDLGAWFARRGYVVAIQDVRGRYASDGEFDIFVNEPADGYDTVEWLADRPYCTGAVGTLGTSYSAWTQNALASLDPPSLAAMFVNQGAANGWEATLRHNGTFELRWLLWALTIGGGFSHRALEDRDVQRAIAEVDPRAVLANAPPSPGQTPLRHIPGYERWVMELMTAPGTDDRWDERGINFTAYVDEAADVPTVYAGGWYDSYTKATSDSFRTFTAAKDSDHYLIVGPWTHGGQESWSSPTAGEVWFGNTACVDYRRTQLAFFDRYLEGEATWDRDPVTYFRMGAGESPSDATATGSGELDRRGAWATAADWPLPATRVTRYFAHADGRLSPEPPDDPDGKMTYEFDPADPVPTIGGNCSSYYTFAPHEASLEEYPLEERRTISLTGRGGFDQRTRPDTFGADPPYGPLEERDDVLTFRTSPLAAPVEIAGPIRATVWGATDAPDTDFTTKLIHEFPPSSDFPDGFALNLCDSVCRGRYRGYRREPDPLVPGEVYAFEMAPYPTANRFPSGHRIRLDISSSNFPRYDINHNTGGSPGDRERTIASNTVHLDRDHPTHVELPIQPTR